ncbi:hypothetical protein R3P38DRAFT_3217201 [Favolaschia claudopus]|uniref:Uncharacterized protein n=1 Tax=Favolaschia claudopus TaxID=2862362 RepID=A0AAW0A581_9AGAR
MYLGQLSEAQVVEVEPEEADAAVEEEQAEFEAVEVEVEAEAAVGADAAGGEEQVEPVAVVVEAIVGLDLWLILLSLTPLGSIYWLKLLRRLMQLFNKAPSSCNRLCILHSRLKLSTTTLVHTNSLIDRPGIAPIMISSLRNWAEFCWLITQMLQTLPYCSLSIRGQPWWTDRLASKDILIRV